jgi:hypothetical protein
MKKITIHAPIWKTRSIGIARYKITDNLIVTIDYKTKDGNLLYPEKYAISKERALTYPTQTIRDNLILHIIPIDDMEVIREE